MKMFENYRPPRRTRWNTSVWRIFISFFLFFFFFLEIGGAVSAAGGVSDGVSPLPPFTFLPCSTNLKVSFEEEKKKPKKYPSLPKAVSRAQMALTSARLMSVIKWRFAPLMCLHHCAPCAIIRQSLATSHSRPLWRWTLNWNSTENEVDGGKNFGICWRVTWRPTGEKRGKLKFVPQWPGFQCVPLFFCRRSGRTFSRCCGLHYDDDGPLFCSTKGGGCVRQSGGLETSLEHPPGGLWWSSRGLDLLFDRLIFFFLRILVSLTLLWRGDGRGRMLMHLIHGLKLSAARFIHQPVAGWLLIFLVGTVKSFIFYFSKKFNVGVEEYNRSPSLGEKNWDFKNFCLLFRPRW